MSLGLCNCRVINAVTVTRSGDNLASEVEVTLTLTNGTATAPEDYDNTSLVVSFASGQTSRAVVIPIIDDNNFEEEETINLVLSSPTGGATIGTQGVATLTIVDNDSQPNQPITGTINSDNLIGNSGNNTLIGTISASTTPGRNEIDRLTGGAGADVFVLGDANRVYYDDVSRRSPGTGDYALITDFSLAEGDVIQLRGTASQYSLGSSPVSSVSGTGVFLTAGQLTPELIGIVQGQTLTNFNTGFRFVSA